MHGNFVFEGGSGGINPFIAGLVRPWLEVAKESGRSPSATLWTGVDTRGRQ